MKLAKYRPTSAPTTPNLANTSGVWSTFAKFGRIWGHIWPNLAFGRNWSNFAEVGANIGGVWSTSAQFGQTGPTGKLRAWAAAPTPWAAPPTLGGRLRQIHGRAVLPTPWEARKETGSRRPRRPRTGFRRTAPGALIFVGIPALERQFPGRFPSDFPCEFQAAPRHPLIELLRAPF